MSKSKKLLGSRIRHLRKKNGFSQEQFAEQIGIDPNSISRIECGVRYPSLDTLEKISTVLAVELRELFLFSNKESADEIRSYITHAISEMGIEKLREVAQAVKKVI